jgi:hypothetical protein
MLIVRDIFQVKWGQSNAMVTLFKEIRAMAEAKGRKGFATRILTDASGPFFTVVIESEVANLGEWERTIKETFADPDFAAWFARSAELVETGRREFYNLEG